MYHLRRAIVASVLNALLVVGCGGSGNRAPSATAATFHGIEDEVVLGVLQASDPDGDAISYLMLVPPRSGTVELDASTGAFRYVPGKDFFGRDRFAYAVSDGSLQSPSASVEIQIEGRNDPPVLEPIGDVRNSATERVVRIELSASDVDSHALTFDVVIERPEIASITIERNILYVTPRELGGTQVTVNVHDGELSASQSFRVSVEELEKSAEVSADMMAGDAISIRNRSDEAVTFRLVHNGFPLFRSADEVAAYIDELPGAGEKEPFERRLWQFIRDNVYHGAPVSAETWLYDPLVTLNSFGWGFCGHVASSYVLVARARGYEARVWGLTGHVVPEIRIGDRWQMYDPDLAVYYLDRDGSVAGVEQLIADPALITQPGEAILLDYEAQTAYSPYIAQIYASAEDNFDGEVTFLTPDPTVIPGVELPPGAQLVYPGRWTPFVIGYDGTVPGYIPHYLQAAITLENGWTGRLTVPWVLWEVRGSGRLQIAGSEYSIESAELDAFLKSPDRFVREVDIVESTSPIQLIFFVNARRYELEPVNHVTVSSKDIWALDIGLESLPESARVPGGMPYSLLKPRPPGLVQ